MKLIFLDFDGVLNSKKTIIAWAESTNRNDNLDKEMISRLNKIVEATQAKVVISSTWRKIHSVEHLSLRLQQEGFRGEVIGETPILNKCRTNQRENEIASWIKENENLNITNFVILDDDSNMGNLMPFLVQTKFDCPNSGGGLQEEHITLAIKMLED